MKNTTKLFATSLFAASGLFLTSCDVDKTSEGEAPEVDVDVDADPGKIPSYEVNTPEVETGTKKVEVEVPTVEVKPAEDGDDN